MESQKFLYSFPVSESKGNENRCKIIVLTVFGYRSYVLRSVSFIAPLMRKFSPLAEDATTLKNELLWKNVIKAMDCHIYEEDNSSWEFLDDIRRDQSELQQIG